MLEGLRLVALASAASPANLGSTAGHVRLGVLAGLAGATVVLRDLAACLASAKKQRVLARRSNQSELIKRDALATSAGDALTGALREAKGSDADRWDLRQTDVIEHVAEPDFSIAETSRGYAKRVRSWALETQTAADL